MSVAKTYSKVIIPLPFYMLMAMIDNTIFIFKKNQLALSLFWNNQGKVIFFVVSDY